MSVIDPQRWTLRALTDKRRLVWSGVGLLLAIIGVFVVVRLTTDLSFITAGNTPSVRTFARRYVLNPLQGETHVIAAAVYIAIAPFQVNRRFRTRHFRLHRAMGRVAVCAGLVAAVFAVVFGVLHPYGGSAESSASVVFGCYFGFALAWAFAAARRRDFATHRRWMIRAFAVGLGVSTIRIWVGLFQLAGLISIQSDPANRWFGIAFWPALVMHAAGAEVYLRARVVRRRA